MHLREYIDRNNINVTAFAQEVGVSRNTIYAYIRGERRPSLKTYNRIKDRTEGQVDANSFFGLLSANEVAGDDI
jgi:predicted transcriptional regulator